MTDARDRLAQGLEILMARPYNYWHLKEAADAIAAFVEERVQTEALARHNQDLQRDKTILRLEELERRHHGGTEAARSGREQSPPAGAASVQPVPAPESGGGLSGTHNYDRTGTNS